MKNVLILLFFTVSIFAQQPVDSVFTPKEQLAIAIDSGFVATDANFVATASIVKDSVKRKKIYACFSDTDLKKVDSLLIEKKFNASSFDTIQYVINDKDIIGNTTAMLSTDLLKKRLHDLNLKTPFHLAYSPSLEKVINSYLKYRTKYYPALMAKAQYYFPMFEQYLDQFDVPLEMKYLAIVESALRPAARSRVGATGLWQFMYGTGVQFDLKVNSYVDERQNPVKATIAACKYLSHLHKIFGDWDLALAAYNSGPGNVSKAIKRSGGYRNYWNIRPYLPRETASYVPAFYATMYIFEYAEAHNIYPEPPTIFHFETDTIQVKRTVTFDQIAAKTNIDTELLSFLNPSYKLAVIPYAENKNYAVRLPKKHVIDFLEKEQDIYVLANTEDGKREKPLPKYFEEDKQTRYKVRNGDYLGKIATKFGVKVSQIKRWNGMRSHRLKIGQRLKIYPKKLTAHKKVIRNKNKLPKGPHKVYVVESGDSLWTISKKYPSVSIDQIKKWNNIWSVKSLKPGMKLKIFKS
ncbi:LysM peptidoglycan-binding domain-containing protein [Tenacibaculum finnmarkense genomovar finnmarkense]|uniref:lytic transglycosylase domain-containing protein n=3 Tax=Tenacibaculum finnmarkense TaxID=2781243 RepID=UPI001E5B8D6A|nr:lytic transglycosylase domain-containing protein [Tenacibaculum finnmarkense]MCD8417072.1 LysM peptidoglycan-binding domain-containing protein [Tenacibaculum finnmarkense genomovar finnmarkense]MCG8184535.1 LysM peptidoglycan-binding domain-containing protein [Tenacibaculum finnmarkense genomovar finnmarkense]MCG8202004.1 LysM peptidoglycan-binding domain-containing protein [Tenacibaculum finnmarkense genomovar finnmarkense]MCG8208759.1 LysM peptidoglycan-binding domain-containing protein [T